MQERHIAIGARVLEVHATADAPRICAAHTTDAFGGATAELLAETASTSAACVTLPKGGAAIAAFDTIVDELEAVRRELAAPPWIFWGMSGGGWLALAYAHRHPDGLAGIVVESACACFRARLGDPACALSPMFPAWRE
ncbi:MAG TPA: alpha/beta fold hydrolase, partial [Nannocystaceae bacterium]|nr:alpha/beta fold hydrolase [Nannocystaceae bacterium]